MSTGRRPGGNSRGKSRGEYSRKYTPKRKVCAFCVDKIAHIDYKDIPRLRRHISERGKIEPRKRTGTCAKHQRAVAVALKRARHVALLPYTAEHIRTSGMVLRSPEDRRPDRGPRPPMAIPAEGATEVASDEVASENGVMVEAPSENGAAVHDEAAPEPVAVAVAAEPVAVAVATEEGAE